MSPRRFHLSRRINIGQKYQAEIPDLQDQLSSQFDQHKADLVWLPIDDSHLSPSDQQRSERLTLPAHPPTLCCSFPCELFVAAQLILPNGVIVSALSVGDMMNMACSSVLRGGGTNQELVLHCLHECGGDFLVSMVTYRDSTPPRSLIFSDHLLRSC